MKFVCERCQTRYSIADEKVRQKILRIRCKTCGSVILVQESSALPEGVHGDAAPHVAHVPSAVSGAPAAKVASGPKSPPAPLKPASGSKTPLSPAGQAASVARPPTGSSDKSPSWLKSPTSETQKARAAAMPPPPPPAVALDPLGGRVEWYVAVGGVQSGPFSRTEAAKRVFALGSSQPVHVWKEGMSGWKTPNEVSVIAREINLLRPVPPPPPPVHTPKPARPEAKASAPSAPAPLTPAPLSTSHSPAGKQIESPAPATGKKATAPLRVSSVAEISEFHAEADTDAEIFPDVATEKKGTGSEALPQPFADEATTRKGKRLRHLEDDPLPAPSEVVNPSKTPLPLHVPQLPTRRTGAVPVAPGQGEPSGVAKSPSFVPAGLESGPLLTLERDESPTTPVPVPTHPTTPLPSFAGSFSDVVAAMAAVGPSGAATGSAPVATVVPVTSGAFAPTAVVESKKSRLVELFQGRSGLKYVIAAGVLVALVILLVVANLRGASAKRPEIVKEPPKQETPAPEQPSAVEDPVVAPPTEEKVSSHSGGKHVTVKSRAVGPGEHSTLTERTVGPVRTASSKTTNKSSPDSARPNPFADTVVTASQEKILAVIRDKNNQIALRTCYDRALKMDNHLTSGRMDVTVSIASSGAVQRVVVNAPSSFMMIEPCIKLAVRRWHFPANSEEYSTNFPLIMQGGM